MTGWPAQWAARLPKTGLVLPASCSRLWASSAVNEGVKHQVDQLRTAMLEAVEGAEMVRESATQLMLETDPAARESPKSYEQHYAELALIQLQHALQMHDQLRQSLGREQADRLLKQEKLAVVVADCMLWRDRMQQTIQGVNQVISSA